MPNAMDNIQPVRKLSNFLKGLWIALKQTELIKEMPNTS